MIGLAHSYKHAFKSSPNAQDHGTTVDELQDVNGIDGSRIFVGQIIDVPLGSS